MRKILFVTGLLLALNLAVRANEIDDIRAVYNSQIAEIRLQISYLEEEIVSLKEEAFNLGAERDEEIDIIEEELVNTPKDDIME